MICSASRRNWILPSLFDISFVQISASLSSKWPSRKHPVFMQGFPNGQTRSIFWRSEGQASGLDVRVAGEFGKHGKSDPI